MGMSYALFEEHILDQHTGRMVNLNLERYKLASPGETPAIDVVVLGKRSRSERDRCLRHRRTGQHCDHSQRHNHQATCLLRREFRLHPLRLQHPTGPTKTPPGP
jgi:hypothetical protein